MADLMRCQFCLNLMGMFRRKSEFPSNTGYHSYFDDLGTISDIIEMPCPHADSIRMLWARVCGLKNEDFEQGRLRGWTLGMETIPNTALNFYLNGRLRFDVFISLVVRPDRPGNLGTTRVLSPQWTDPSIPRDWYSKCLNEHGSACHQPTWMRQRPQPIAMPEWLVDAVENCVVPCTSDTARYITLSYTWGGVQGLRHTSMTLERLKKRGSLHRDQAPDIPRTIRDALEITRLLGERYLWVDSLCIAQDETASSKDLNSMHHIYANSMICLIALAGKDANHGLRGIQGTSAPRYIEQVILDMAGGESLSCFFHKPMLSDPIARTTDGSGYNERGWTYQENLFAKRRLIFTGDLLRWSCECCEWGEESCGGIEEDPSAGSGVSTTWMTTLGPDLNIIESAAHDFNTRFFTYEADTLRAFLGVQNYINRDFLGGLNYGHPEMFFDISLLWKGYSDLKRRLSNTTIAEPPSWSWMGWQSMVFFDADQEYLPWRPIRYDVGFTQSVARWYKAHSPMASVSDMLPVECKWQIYRNAFKNGSTRVPVGWRKVANNDRSEYFYRRGRNNLGRDYRYPVPLPPFAVAAEPAKQRPFIHARTTRSFFVAKRRVAFHYTPVLELFSRDGERAGLLELHHALDKPLHPVELVAVVKGWTTAFSQYFLSFQGREEPGILLWPTGLIHQRDRIWLRHSCIFVLCVEWVDGVAKRRGTGMVEADIWERNREPVDLILG